MINAPPFCMENFEFSILKKLTHKLIEILLSGNTKKKKKKKPKKKNNDKNIKI